MKICGWKKNQMKRSYSMQTIQWTFALFILYLYLDSTINRAFCEIIVYNMQYVIQLPLNKQHSSRSIKPYRQTVLFRNVTGIWYQDVSINRRANVDKLVFIFFLCVIMCFLSYKISVNNFPGKKNAPKFAYGTTI